MNIVSFLITLLCGLLNFDKLDYLLFIVGIDFYEKYKMRLQKL